MRDVLELTGNATMYLLAYEQTEKIFQIVSLVLSIIISILIIIGKIVSWFKKANSDNKITPDEIAEITNDVKEDVEKIKKDIDNFNKGE